LRSSLPGLDEPVEICLVKEQLPQFPAAREGHVDPLEDPAVGRTGAERRNGPTRIHTEPARRRAAYQARANEMLSSSRDFERALYQMASLVIRELGRG
jgi:hypothetical protein